MKEIEIAKVLFYIKTYKVLPLHYNMVGKNKPNKPT
ncbi:hypothetical protein J2X17_001846 [Flavobacterium aquidurense]|nr:hypothetical protein [Flavobacterium aquidurense]